MPLDPRKHFVAGCAGFVLFVGVLVLIGWQWSVTGLKSILPGAISMKANTAIGLMLLALSLWVGEKGRQGWRLTFAALAGTLGGLTASEYAFGINLGIDEFFFV